MSKIFDEEHIRQAKRYREKAEEAFLNKDYDKAKKILLISEELHPTDAAKDFLNYLQDFANVSTEESNHNGDEEKKDIAEKCIEKARMALSRNDIEKAKQLLKKAERNYSTDVAKDMLNELGESIMIEPVEEINYNQVISRTESDRIEAERCIDVAQNAMSEKKFKKAEKFLLKAKRLYPLTYADVLLKDVQKRINNGENIDDTEDKSRDRSEKNREIETEKEESRNERLKERREAIARLKIGSNDPYEVLGVDKNADKSFLKKTAKRLMGWLHPDKNKEPGAEEAFRAVTEAAQKLKTTE